MQQGKGVEGIYVHVLDTDSLFCVYACEGVVGISAYSMTLHTTHLWKVKTHIWVMGTSKSMQCLDLQKDVGMGLAKYCVSV